MVATNEILVKLRELKPMLAERYALTKLGIFGSFARNDASEVSDIDVVVEMEGKFRSYLEVQELLEQSLSHKIDLIRLHDHMRPRFKNRILQEALYV
ncbi:nucleotidyltransferase family protein [Sulfuricurvum sp.]|uniref:nucleotidyltransferase family protein n=1 Tax=Sulfuricurvum sp. TaxID=2025608 RepID=UPI002D2B78E8|nr:nucleotidyltransferase domain-containing protein [Sulfuricurvum sp.]HZF70924.1 nucleotidyltransferase domain-containing protein [Sulfuricurvum sp.]